MDPANRWWSLNRGCGRRADGLERHPTHRAGDRSSPTALGRPGQPTLLWRPARPIRYTARGRREAPTPVAAYRRRPRGAGRGAQRIRQGGQRRSPHTWSGGPPSRPPHQNPPREFGRLQCERIRRTSEADPAAYRRNYSGGFLTHFLTHSVLISGRSHRSVVACNRSSPPGN